MQDFLNTLLVVFSTFIPVLNPFGGAMFFYSMTPEISYETRKKLVNRIIFYSAILLTASLLAGHLILSFFGISMGALHLAGGLVLMAAGWTALNAEAITEDDPTVQVAPKSRIKLLSMAFYPFTLPLTIGPGMISVGTAIGTTAFVKGLPAIAGVIIATIISLWTVWICFRHCDKISKAIGAGGADALARVFAFILLCIGISHLWQGFTELWSSMGA